ncbi:MAG: DUF2283 domain-containing protein [candidate division WOR-3 bacterium]
MKISIDKEADALYISLTDARVSESEEVAPGVIVDYDEKGEVVAIEILKVSERLGEKAESVEIEV